MANARPAVLRILWSRFSWRHWRTAPVSSALLLLILAVGVAAFFSIRLANRAAVASFQDFTALITSQSDGVLSSPVGTLPDAVLAEIRAVLGNQPVNLVPVLEASAVAPSREEHEAIGSRPTFQILGLDLPALVNLTHSADPSQRWSLTAKNESGEKSGPGLWPVMRQPASIFISAALAARDHLQAGSSLALIINEHPVTLTVLGIIPTNPRQPAAPANLLIMDLPALQQFTDKSGQLDRIEIVLEDGPNHAARWAKVKAQLETAGATTPPRWQVATPADRQASAALMTQAFRLNLTILSLLGLLVGLYLVFQGLDGAVVRRRGEIAILRSLGVTSGQIQAAWLVEAAAIGLAGGLLGLGLGWLGAQFAVQMVGRTVNALYFANSVDSAAFDWPEALLALTLAVLASMLAGWQPARVAANTPPAQIAVRTAGANYAGGILLHHRGLGIAFTLLGLALTWLPPVRLAGGGRISVAAYGTALCWILGAGIFAGLLLSGIGRLLHSWNLDSVRLRLAASQLRSPSGRHRLLVASLVSAVGMTAGMAILVGSFDVTMRGWIARTFQADLFISSDGAQSASTPSRISPATWKSLLANPAVARANVVQVMEIKLDGITTLLIGNRLAFFRDYARPAWVSAPDSEAVFDPQKNADLVIVSEAFSERFRRQRGDQIEIMVPGGRRHLTIAGIFADYGNERGSVLVEQQQFTNWFGNELAASVILALQPGQDAEALRATWRREHPGLGIFTSAYLRGESLRIFHQTFAVTYALELIGLVVAVAGLAFTMASLLWERRAELATLRALGTRRNEIAGAAAGEGALTAAAGVLMGLLLSVALGWLLIHRINKQTFGWTLQTERPWGQLAALAVLLLASAVMVGWCVGRWAARLPAEREE